MRLNLVLPLTLRRRIDAHLWNEGERRVPIGAYQEFFIELIERFFDGHSR